MNITSSKANRLANEQSPYLLMHAYNPVDWYPWCEEAFAKAETEKKLVIVSIGYAACHWCHVMEHESFSDQEVAQIMNEHFVSIKVDREERPDIDSIYMDAVQIISGQGGWPLNAIILPNGKPIFAATYFPRNNWIDLLNQIQHLYKTNNENLVEQAQEITNRIQHFNTHYINQANQIKLTNDAVYNSFQNLIKSVDFRNGGLNSAPKFPMPVVFEYLLHYFHFTADEKALNAITITLDKMAMGGIYDQIGGGFARYSTDNYWKVPHFEKMLYDNAQLVSLYSKAYKHTKNEHYANVVAETLAFIGLEMTSDEYGFYSAIDADSDGDEGKFYVWNYDELKSILDVNEMVILDYFSIKEQGNWEHQVNILFKTMTDGAFIVEKGLFKADFNSTLTKVKKKLLDLRNTRIKPLTDTKIITAWNALMIIGYLDAYNALGNRVYLTIAIRNAKFIIEKLKVESKLYRNYKDGKQYNNAKLDDYTNVIRAFISLYQNTFDEYWLNHANNLMEFTIQHFYDAQTGMFFYTSDQDEVLIARQFEIPDQVIPSSNSVMALNLYYMGFIYDNDSYMNLSEKMLYNVQTNILESTAYFANWAKLQILFMNPPFEVSIVGEKSLEFNETLNKYFLPNSIIIGSVSESKLPLLQHKFIENKTCIYICKDKVCQLPICDLNEAIIILNDRI